MDTIRGLARGCHLDVRRDDVAYGDEILVGLDRTPYTTPGGK